MNFDNNGMKFGINTKDPKQFNVFVNTRSGDITSFGVNSDGVFINHLIVDSNGKGIYKRPSKYVNHTSKLVKDILNGTIPSDDIGSYMQRVEIVNVPDYSIHNMICDRSGNVWVAEPGRGIIHSPVNEASYFILTNFSLCDYKATGLLDGSGVDRYKITEELLSKADELDVNGAFKILEAAMQKDVEWITDFSMVYSQQEKTVYYCFERDFNNIQKYSFII
jgi:hypothetical protein